MLTIGSRPPAPRTHGSRGLTFCSISAVAALHGVEVQFRPRSRPAPCSTRRHRHADPIRGPAELHHQHGGNGRVLSPCARVIWPMPPLNMMGLSHSRRSPFGSRRPNERRVPLKTRLAELVAVVRGAVWTPRFRSRARGEVRRIAEVGVLPRQPIARDPQVPHAVTRRCPRPPASRARGVPVADPAARARFGAGERGHARREVVVSREDDVVVEVAATNRAGTPGCSGTIVTDAGARMALECRGNAITLLFGFASSVPLMRPIRWCGASRPSTTSRPLKNQWRECSLLDCAMSKHSRWWGSAPPAPEEVGVVVESSRRRRGPARG